MNGDQWTYVGMAIFALLMSYICYWILGTQYPGCLCKMFTCKCFRYNQGLLEQYDSSEVPKCAESKEKSTRSSKKTNSKSTSYSSSETYQVRTTEFKEYKPVPIAETQSEGF